MASYVRYQVHVSLEPRDALMGSLCRCTSPGGRRSSLDMAQARQSSSRVGEWAIELQGAGAHHVETQGHQARTVIPVTDLPIAPTNADQPAESQPRSGNANLGKRIAPERLST